jgi:hypothetical protein
VLLRRHWQSIILDNEQDTEVNESVAERCTYVLQALANSNA